MQFFIVKVPLFQTLQSFLATLLTTHEYWMKKAIDLAKCAAQAQEIPIGAIVVDDHNQLLGQGYNQSIILHDPTAHAEILAIRQACQSVQNYRLLNCRLYVTVQPCLMCLTTALHARIRGIFFGIPSEKKWPLFTQSQKEKLWSFWNVSSCTKTIKDAPCSSNWIGSLELQGNILQSECLCLLQDFFRNKRRH